MTEIDYGAMRHKINDSIVEAVEEEETEETLVFGWVLIYEGVHQNDKRSLTYLTSDGTGDKGLPPWVAKGYVQHYMDVPFVFEEDNGEEEDDEYD